MKKTFAGLLLGLLLGPLAAGFAVAQGGAPAVQSIDILDQTQAERSVTQPGNMAPVFRAIKSGETHYSSLPALEAGMLIQPKARFIGQENATTAGEAWRKYRNGPLTTIGGWMLIIMPLALLAFYLAIGPIRLKSKLTGRLIERFTSIERVAHWTVAISFITLAISGIIMLFGKHVLMPVFGHQLFGWLTYGLKNVHNFVGPVFFVSIIVFFFIFVKSNFPHKSDLEWIKKGGGMTGKGGHVSSQRFNAGEKIWFWGGMVVLGLIVSASGLVLDVLVPGMLYTRGNMQIASIVHIIGSVMIASGSMAHIYIGTVGMQGAYSAMRTGYVDDAWAKEHHDLWYQDVVDGKVPRIRTEKKEAVSGNPSKAT